MHYEYTNNKTGEVYRLEGLQEKYGLGFAQKELWDIIEYQYTTREVESIDMSGDIEFED